MTPATPRRPPPPGRPTPAPPGPLRRLDALGRAAVPAIVTALLMVAAAVPVGLPGPVAAVALPCVFFWSVVRPAAMPPPAVFALGLLQDLLSFSAFGAGVLTLLAAHGLAVRWRRQGLARQGFLRVWAAFCAAAAGAAALGWALEAALTPRLAPAAPGLHMALLSMGLYPALAVALTWLHGAIRGAAEEEGAP